MHSRTPFLRWTGPRRRAVGLFSAIAPVGVLGASLVVALGGGGERRLVGLAITIPALHLGALNFHLSVVRPLIHLRRKKSREGYRHISGFPIVGTVLVTIGALAGFGSALVAALGLVTVAIDTGGIAWFVYSTWNDASLWDR